MNIANCRPIKQELQCSRYVKQDNLKNFFSFFYSNLRLNPGLILSEAEAKEDSPEAGSMLKWKIQFERLIYMIRLSSSYQSFPEQKSNV